MAKQIYYACIYENEYSNKPLYPMCCKGRKNVGAMRAEIRNHSRKHKDCCYYILTTDKYGCVVVEKYKYRYTFQKLM